MAQVDNYDWLNCIPKGWENLARKMIQECEAIEPNYTIADMKEKWGELRIVSYVPDKEGWPTPSDHADKLLEIENKYTEQSTRTCCKCGKPATKYSTGWILPWCDDCGIKEYGSYKEFNHDSAATNNN